MPTAERPLRILSLGAGVQSTTLALMSAHGEVPPIDCAVFADTQSEPQAVYDHLEKLMAPGVLPFPVIVVTKGSLKQEILDACAGKKGAWGRPPLFLINPDGSHGMTRRQCTQDYKIDVIQREVRRLAGIVPRSRGPKFVAVQQVIGISLDEAQRQRDARFRWLVHTYPLVEMRISREACVAKLAAWGWLTVPKSACTFCPYHNDTMWHEMKVSDPASFQDAINVDDALRAGEHYLLKGTPFLHAARIPLSEVDFADRLAKRAARAAKGRTVEPDAFGEECAGICGV